MRNLRPNVIVAMAVLSLLAAILFVRLFLSAGQEKKEIAARYEQMRMALASGDTNSARALFAPIYRGGAHRSFDMLGRFAKPLAGSKSGIRLWKSQALVCPDRIFHFYVIPGGHTIEMVKVDGAWFFTGKINID